MATIGKKRKAPAKRKATGAAKKRKARVGAPKASPLTLLLGGVRFKKVSCGKTKADATKTAKVKRAKGQRARVVKNPAGGFCVYARGRATKRG